MHCAWNFPTEENSKKLAKYAALLGIDYYVIDCAWHDEEDDCWLYIGNWIESKKRYPNGLKNTLDYIKGLGLKTGLWLELEAVGIRGNAIDMWEDDCFFQRNGKKVINSGRYQLDFRNQKVIKRMNELIDRVVNDYEVDYIKIDYNQCSGPGTDLNSCSLGDGLLDHSRAYRCWIESVFKKYPDLVIENCASGGQRMDYALMSLHSIQSTSDQTDYKKYPYIVSNMITAVTPEQSAVWSYPIEDKQDVLTVTNESVAMNMINSMLGRLHLSSSIDLLDAEKTALIKEGIQYYNLMSDNKKHSDPYWPLGLCYWGEKTAIAGIKTDRICYLSVYNLGSDGTVEIPLQDLNISSIKVGYPKEMNTNYQYDNKKLTVKFEKEFEARLFEIELEKGD
jgi:alpha-galactosidase